MEPQQASVVYKPECFGKHHGLSKGDHEVFSFYTLIDGKESKITWNVIPELVAVTQDQFNSWSRQEIFYKKTIVTIL